MCEVKLVCSSTTLIVMTHFYNEVSRFPRLLHLLHHQSLLLYLVQSLSFNFFASKLDPTIPYTHSEIRMTLLIWPWSVKIAGEDLSLSPQIPRNSSRIPLGCFETAKTSLMRPWFVELTGLKSAQSCPGSLQTLRISWITAEISFRYRSRYKRRSLLGMSSSISWLAGRVVLF